MEEELKTNASRIRNMSDAELAGFLCRFRGHLFPCSDCVAYKYCDLGHNGMLDWLQQPTEEKHEIMR